MGVTEKKTITLESAAILSVRSDGIIEAANSKAVELIGIPANELIGTPANNVFNSRKDFSFLGPLYEKASRGHVICSYPVRLRQGEDSSCFVLATLIPTPGNSDIPTAVLICLNSTSEQAYINQVALDSIAGGVLTTDARLNISSFNSGAEKITGKKRDQVIGTPCSQVLRCSECSNNCMLQKSIQEKTPITDRSMFIQNEQGEPVPVCMNTAPLLDNHGNVIGAISSFYDNTLSLWSDLILKSVADGVFTVDKNWKITSFNKAAENITGWTAQDAIGKSCSEVFKTSICGKNCAIAESLYAGQSVSNRSITITSKQGEKIPISISAAPLSDHEGNIIGGVETFRDLSALTALRKQLTRKYHFGEIVSKSKAMQRLFAIMPEVSASPSTVMILGESGTGKELIARAVHNVSGREKQPFVALNCGALPENLLESELFGYKAGAFTDAKTDKDGRFAAAEGGTLFLDEIGDIPLAVQAKLLRVLQEKVYEPLGSNTPVETDVRIITATNKDLKKMVVNGTFREDLFYRLNVVRIQLPALRERKEDILLLIKQFIREFCAQQGKEIVGISTPALNLLMRYDFPGNIRELKNIIEYAFILCDGGFILPNHLPQPFSLAENDEVAETQDPDRAQTLEEIEKQAIFLALQNNNWKRAQTSRELGISKDTLRRKMIKYHLDQSDLF